MPSEFLKCIICPRKPRFSDASHLLTHISSKGHLAHLHNLQVRSHQEASAGHNLTTYDQWFRDHDVAQQLSQRLQDKEAKQAEKQAANRRRALTGNKRNGRGKKNREQAPISPYSAQASIVHMRKAEGGQDIGQNFDQEISPIRRSRRLALFNSSPSPLTQVTTGIGGDEPRGFAPNVTRLSCGPELKGTVWPGMRLFDAATDEMKRKRNQRKDSSILTQMERHAATIEPTETVYSATGQLLTQRHIDELEHATPVLGEPLLLRPTPKRRRSVRLGSSDDRPERARRTRRQPKSPLKHKTHRQVSLGHIKSGSPQVSAESEVEEFKTRIGNLTRKRKTAGFSVYQDPDSPFGVNDSPNQTCSPDLSNIAHCPNSQYAYPALSLPNYQHPEFDPFRAIREKLTFNETSATIGTGKENIVPPLYGLAFGHHEQCSNPLSSYLVENLSAWRTTSANDMYESGSIIAGDSLRSDISGLLVPARNPLMAALQTPERRHRLPKPYAPTAKVDQPLGRILFTPSA